MTDKPPVRVLLVDDHEVVRKGLRALLEAADGFEVVSEAGSVVEAIRRVGYDSPDVVVMDVRLPDGSGIDACREIRKRWPDVKVLILTSYADEEALVGAIQAGASGYVLKRIRADELAESIQRVAAGESLLDPIMTEQLFTRIRGGNSDPLLERLSPQERRTLDLIAAGMTNKQIAKQMFLAEKTVKNYVSNMLSKLEMSRRSEAAAYAARLSVGSRVRYPAETWDEEQP
ncbi:MAG: response regulator transcription factor [Acidobacteria bacterium]|nr:response regulator transcription factor [Acidobacteriota bacterium]